jgi:hypothetical protein
MTWRSKKSPQKPLVTLHHFVACSPLFPPVYARRSGGIYLLLSGASLRVRGPARRTLKLRSSRRSVHIGAWRQIGSVAYPKGAVIHTPARRSANTVLRHPSSGSGNKKPLGYCPIERLHGHPLAWLSVGRCRERVESFGLAWAGCGFDHRHITHLVGSGTRKPTL